MPKEMPVRVLQTAIAICKRIADILDKDECTAQLANNPNHSIESLIVRGNNINIRFWASGEIYSYNKNYVIGQRLFDLSQIENYVREVTECDPY